MNDSILESEISPSNNEKLESQINTINENPVITRNRVSIKIPRDASAAKEWTLVSIPDQNKKNFEY